MRPQRLRACSAVVRNRRYYRTVNGRTKKRQAASRYFQKYRLELYAKKAQRFARWFEESMTAEMRCHRIDPHDADILTSLVVRKEAPAIIRSIRRNHDFHPAQFHDWGGKMRWLVDWADGKLKPYWVKGIYQTELTIKAQS
jgi:hypothetical protein